MSKVICADSHYYNNGKYDFKPERLSEVHNKCLVDFASTLAVGSVDQDATLVVDNTNIYLFELAPYYRWAEVFGHEVEIVWVHCDPNIAAKRNVHEVPAHVVFKAALSFDPLPPWWNVKHVYNL